MQQATLAIIKPDALHKNIIGQIIRRAEDADLTVVAMKMVQLSKKQAQDFYYIHRDKPFFHHLVEFMAEGPILFMVLRGEDAVARWRRIMGVTDPAEAAQGSIRKVFGENIERNSVHGSDSPDAARFEIGYAFGALELVR